MFNPLDFIALAEELGKVDKEQAKLRTSLSRAYYGVFLYAREKLIKGGWEILFMPHRLVPYLLNMYKEGRNIRYKLDTLRKNRTSADYELGEEFTPQKVEEIVVLAQETIKEITEKDFQKPSL